MESAGNGGFVERAKNMLKRPRNIVIILFVAIFIIFGLIIFMNGGFHGLEKTLTLGAINKGQVVEDIPDETG